MKRVVELELFCSLIGGLICLNGDKEICETSRVAE